MQLLFRPAASYANTYSGEVVVVAPGNIPTVDFYITSRIHAGTVVHRYYGDDFDFSAFTQRQSGAFVIIVRHASRSVLNLLYQYRHLWSGVAFLMDDDIPGAWRCRDIPLDYALWTSSRYLAVRHQLAALCDRIWVSTSALQHRYSDIKTTLVPPMSFGKQRPVAAQGCRRWAYHGTRVHQEEIRWLVPIVAAVNAIVPDAEFELFGNARIAKLFKGIPRVVVKEPLSWLDYLDYCNQSEVAVGLAPMLPGRYNAVRSHTKVFDIARCGAVGLFSESEAYQSLSGVVSLLANIPEIWIAEIVKLLTDDGLRFEQYAQLEHWQHNVVHADKLESLILAES